MLFLYRIARYIYLKRLKGSDLLLIILRYMQHMLTNCEIAPSAMLGRNVWFGHPLGIVIGADAVVGNDVKIFQQVTIGSHGRKGEKQSYPIIGDGTVIYTGAKIIGGITIGKSVTIGANAVVLKDVPDGATAVGVPAKVILKDA